MPWRISSCFRTWRWPNKTWWWVSADAKPNATTKADKQTYMATKAYQAHTYLTCCVSSRLCDCCHRHTTHNIILNTSTHTGSIATGTRNCVDATDQCDPIPLPVHVMYPGTSIELYQKAGIGDRWRWDVQYTINNQWICANKRYAIPVRCANSRIPEL